MATVAVLGGGISGLSCAYYLKTLGKSKIKYLFLLEKSPKFGGWIQTTRYPDGAIFEHGPRTLRVPSRSGYNALQLVEKLDLQSRIVPVTKKHPTGLTNFILSGGSLHPLPRSPLAFFKKTPPIPKALFWYVLHEMRTDRKVLDDESVFSFIERRVGKDIAELIFDPICRGITAGDAKDLSIRSMFPMFFNSEQKHGSIVKGVFVKGEQNPVYQYMESDLVKQAFNENWKMWTLKTGMAELVDALACAIDEREFSDLIFNAECRHIEFRDNKAELSVENEKIVVDHVFSCIPSNQLAKLTPQYPKLCDTLKDISYVDVAVVYLEYTDDVLNYKGFGFLSPSSENSKVLGVVFDSVYFPMLNGDSKTRLTCMIGGKWFRDILGDPDCVTDEQVLNVAVEAARKHLGIQAQPVRHKVIVQRDCIPQYTVGHYKKLEIAEGEIEENNLCLSLLGASYKGASVPDCINNSKLTVEEFLKND